MHQSLHDYYWLYVIAVVILTGAVFFLVPKLVKLLDQTIEAKIVRRVRKDEATEAAEKNKNRYKTF